VGQLAGTLSEQAVYDARHRICDMGGLRVLYKREDGSLGYRCAAEPVEDYVKKGGKAEDTVGRSCLCNNLAATAGFPQVRKDGYVEKPIITAGDDLAASGRYVRAGKMTYSAKDVIDYLLSGLKPGQALGAA
jgi:nitronate monooxygenase